MSNQTTVRVLVERFQKYAAYRKEVKRTRETAEQPFTEKLQERIDHDKSSKRKMYASPRASRRHAPPHLAKPKEIGATQAKRLARYAPLIQEAARRHNVPVELICGVILQESAGNERAVSRAGAKGLMQLMPATARRFGVTNSFEPAQNIDGGTRYLRFLLDRFDGDVRLALAGYNAGEGAVEKHGRKIPPFAETQAYVPKVLGYTQSMIDILAANTPPNNPLPQYARRA